MIINRLTQMKYCSVRLETNMNAIGQVIELIQTLLQLRVLLV